MRFSLISITILCAGLLLLSAPASLAGTTDFGTGLLDLDPLTSPPEIIAHKLKRVHDILSIHQYLPRQEQLAWAERIEDQASDATIPINRSVVDWLYAFLEREDAEQSLGFWMGAYNAHSSIRQVLPFAERTLKLSRRILEFVPPEGMPTRRYMEIRTSAIAALLRAPGPLDLSYMKKMESAEFCEVRARRLTGDVNGRFWRTENGILNSLRHTASWLLADIRPREALSILEASAAVEKDPNYKKALDDLIAKAQQKIAGTYINPDAFDEGNPPDIPWPNEPFIRSLSPPRTPDRTDPMDQFPLAKPILTTYIANSIQPDLKHLKEDGTITQETFELCAMAADKSQARKARIEACRKLRTSDMPFELRRWLTMHHVLLAENQQLVEEWQEVASAWLSEYLQDRPHLSQEWLDQHPSERNINAYLRGYLADVYEKDDVFCREADEKLRRIAEIMRPMFELETPTDRETIALRIFYAQTIDGLTTRWIMQTKRALSDDHPAYVEFTKQVDAIERGAIAEQLVHLRAAESALEQLVLEPSTWPEKPGTMSGPDAELALAVVEELIARKSAVSERRARIAHERGLPVDSASDRETWKRLLQIDAIP
ncbi:MAG: hypothetical protein IT364_11215 [Candidatus Hydrogenedentes bacterium]|nr:hypothetical protein [Candidatus Hydrogenedentota bacterium]